MMYSLTDRKRDSLMNFLPLISSKKDGNYSLLKEMCLLPGRISA
jgi:hypothetical protein